MAEYDIGGLCRVNIDLIAEKFESCRLGYRGYTGVNRRLSHGALMERVAGDTAGADTWRVTLMAHRR